MTYQLHSKKETEMTKSYELSFSYLDNPHQPSFAHDTAVVALMTKLGFERTGSGMGWGYRDMTFDTGHALETHEADAIKTFAQSLPVEAHAAFSVWQDDDEIEDEGFEII